MNLLTKTYKAQLLSGMEKPIMKLLTKTYSPVLLNDS